MGKVCRVVLLPVCDGRVFESDTAAPGAFRPWCRSQGLPKMMVTSLGYEEFSNQKLLITSCYEEFYSKKLGICENDFDHERLKKLAALKIKNTR